MNFTLCKNKCNYTKRNKRSRNPPSLRPTIPKPHYPSPCTTTLASLVKGEVLSPEKIRATTGGIVTPTFRSAPTFPKPHYPSLRTTTLGSLAKGSWIATRLLLTINCLALRFKHL